MLGGVAPDLGLREVSEGGEVNRHAGVDLSQTSVCKGKVESSSYCPSLYRERNISHAYLSLGPHLEGWKVREMEFIIITMSYGR